MDPFIKAENLSVIYNIGKTSEFTALSDVSLKIFSGEYIVFFGPSGCGKSTLLNCLAGLEVPTSGKVFMKNEDLTAFNLQQLITHRRLRIGMVFQNYNLIPTLNILDNVTLPYILGGYTPNFAKEKANILLERFGIPNLQSRYPSELSGGQKQRAAIARSLMYHPPILLADEPVGNLDSESARIVMEVLVELNEKNKETIILVTHDPSYLKFGHRIFYMKDGKIIREAVNYDKKQI
jgi:ABC-type lipoprotein export system ATPase subunit